MQSFPWEKIERRLKHSFEDTNQSLSHKVRSSLVRKQEIQKSMVFLRRFPQWRTTTSYYVLRGGMWKILELCLLSFPLLLKRHESLLNISRADAPSLFPSQREFRDPMHHQPFRLSTHQQIAIYHI